MIEDLKGRSLVCRVRKIMFSDQSEFMYYSNYIVVEHQDKEGDQ